MQEVFLPDEAATTAFAARLAEALASQPGGVIYLEGELGAGKTTLARALLRALGVQGSVRSPTYTLLEPYEVGGREILHMDLYRLREPLELENLGLSDFPPSSTLWLVEWPERAAGLLPPADLRLRLTAEGPARRLRIEAAPDWAARLAGDSPECRAIL